MVQPEPPAAYEHLVVIAGGQKSASSSFAAWLEQHPRVLSMGTEVDHFDIPERSARLTDLERRLERQRLPHHQILLIKRPELLYVDTSVSRLEAWSRSIAKSTTIAIVIRRPVDRFISAFYHYKRFGWISRSVKLDALTESIIRHGPVNVIERQMVDFGYYVPGIERFSERYGKQNIFVIEHDKLLRCPVDAAAALSARIDIDDAASLGTLPRENTGVRHPARLAVVGTAGRLRRRWSGSVPWTSQSPAARLLTAPLMAADRVIAKMVTEPAAEHLGKDRREHLGRWYEPERLALETCLGHSLPLDWFR